LKLPLLAHSLHSVSESKSDSSRSTTEDEDSEASEAIFGHAYDDMNESDDEAAERWYREQGINRDEMNEMFIEHLEEIQDPEPRSSS
jgi:hypothetical protein